MLRPHTTSAFACISKLCPAKSSKSRASSEGIFREAKNFFMT